MGPEGLARAGRMKETVLVKMGVLARFDIYDS